VNGASGPGPAKQGEATSAAFDTGCVRQEVGEVVRDHKRLKREDKGKIRVSS